MPENNPAPLTDAALAELKRLREMAVPGMWKVTPSPSEECLYIDPGVATVFTDYEKPSDREKALADYIASLHNSFPHLLTRLEAAEQERDTAIIRAKSAEADLTACQLYAHEKRIAAQLRREAIDKVTEK